MKRSRVILDILYFSVSTLFFNLTTRSVISKCILELTFQFCFLILILFVSHKTKKDEEEEEEVDIATCTRGQYFGELALVTNKPRAASAYAVGSVKCLGTFCTLL